MELKKKKERYYRFLQSSIIFMISAGSSIIVKYNNFTEFETYIGVLILFIGFFIWIDIDNVKRDVWKLKWREKD